MVATRGAYAESMDAVGAAPWPRWVKTSLLLVAIWSIPGILQATSMYVVYALKGYDELSVGEALVWRVPEWFAWAAATPAIVWLGRRFPAKRLRNLPIHLVACAVVSLGDVVIHYYAGRFVGQTPFVTTPVWQFVPWMLLKTAFFELLVYTCVIVADQAFAYQRRYREAATRQAQLEARLVEAQLDALKMQLHPHFLFNTLNAIGVLMRKGETTNALRMLNGLSELLRRSLSSMRVEMVPLDEELDFIARYLDIETMRFPDRLRVTVDVAPAARAAKVPSLILQPIVENAIEHGIAPRASGGRITITAQLVNDRLRIEIRDDGVGLDAAAETKGHGLGLAHVRERLAQLYPNNHRFTLEGGEPGAIATLEIPA